MTLKGFHALADADVVVVDRLAPLVTHRGISQEFTVVSGHLPPDAPASTLDWDALARGGTTLVILMGADTLGTIVSAGPPPELRSPPVTVIGAVAAG